MGWPPALGCLLDLLCRTGRLAMERAWVDLHGTKAKHMSARIPWRHMRRAGQLLELAEKKPLMMSPKDRYGGIMRISNSAALLCLFFRGSVIYGDFLLGAVIC